MTLSATVVKPDGVSVDGLMPRWSNASVNQGNQYGQLDSTDAAQVKFQNPKKGGLYKFAFNFFFGYAPCSNSTAQVLLPLAGADIMDWLATEIPQIPDWARQHKAAVVAANWSPWWWERKRRIVQTWADISRGYFDYYFNPIDASGQGACYGPNGVYQSGGGCTPFVTINGVVAHCSKANVMLWAIFGRAWGYSTAELRAGAHWNEIKSSLSWQVWKIHLDPISSQNGIELGGRVHDIIESNPAADLKSVLMPVEILRLRQNDDALKEENLWPGNPADLTGSSLSRPSYLPTTPGTI